MPLVYKTPKMNDFLVSTHKSARKPAPGAGYRGVLAYSVSNVGPHMTEVGRGRDNRIFVYHMEKVRPRFERKIEYFTRGAKAGQVKSDTKVKTVEGGWTLRLFAIPADRVKKVKQMTRHFVVELK